MRSLLLALLLLATASVAAGEAQTILLIDIEARKLNNRFEPTGDQTGYVQFKLKNLDTGKIYTRMGKWNRTAYALDVQPGTYCVFALYPYRDVPLRYCGEPFFKVTAHTVNNAGRWEFGIGFNPSGLRLLSAVEDLEGLATDAKTFFPELFDGRDP